MTDPRTSHVRYKPELDGIRGLAIIGVLLTHCVSFVQQTQLTKPLIAVMNFGGFGVDLFFALSGFLITDILLQTKAAKNYFQSFYVRRFLRIFPIYYATLAFLFFGAHVWHWISANMPSKELWWSYLAYVQNVPQFWPHGFVNEHMLSHFWSLAVEEQFYLIWPLIILLVPESWVLAVCGVAVAVALPLRIYFVERVFGGSWAEMIITPSRMDGLFVGAACILLIRRCGAVPKKLIWTSGILGSALLATVAMFQHRAIPALNIRTSGISAVALLAGCLMSVSQLHFPVVDRVLCAKPLRFFGKYSYGIYVFHAPIYIYASRVFAPAHGIHFPLPPLQAAAFVATISGIAVLSAVISFELFESRFLRLKRRFAPIIVSRNESLQSGAFAPGTTAAES